MDFAVYGLKKWDKNRVAQPPSAVLKVGNQQLAPDQVKSVESLLDTMTARYGKDAQARAPVPHI